MRCPYCNNKQTVVTDKRDSNESSVTRRRRECSKCKKRFTTYERAEIEINVIKKNGVREKFDREKLKSGLLKACEKRPVSSEKIDKTIAEIEEKLRKRGKEVKTEVIGKLVMNSLKKLDKISYIRFASVYRDFKDINDFKKQIKEVSK